MGFLGWKELEEVLLDVEITLNNRSLGYVEDYIHLPFLTPNSMLYLNSKPLPEFLPHEIKDHDLGRRAKHLLKCKVAICKPWSQEYLRSLKERLRNLLGGKDAIPVVGDVVILKADEKSQKISIRDYGRANRRERRSRQGCRSSYRKELTRAGTPTFVLFGTLR